MCREDLTRRCKQPHEQSNTPSSPSPSSPSEFTVAKSCTTGRRDSHVMMTLTTLWANLLRVRRLNQRIRQRTNSGVCAMDPEIEFGIMTARRFRRPAVPQFVGAARQSTHAKTRTGYRRQRGPRCTCLGANRASNHHTKPTSHSDSKSKHRSADGNMSTDGPQHSPAALRTEGTPAKVQLRMWNDDRAQHALT